MIEKILTDIYKVEIPIPDNPLQATNCYVVKGSERNLLIDTGFGEPECFEEMLKALAELRVQMEHTDVFVTHFHSDHIGLAPRLLTNTTRLYFNQPEADWLGANTALNDSLDFARSSGWPEDKIESIRLFHRNRHLHLQHLAFHIVHDGDRIPVGDVSLECIETPGHSIGHLCLYERGRKLLFAGDHLLKNITPGLSVMWPYEWDPLKDYLKSLDKVGALDVDLVLPGHSHLFENCRGRVAELKNHHFKRLGDILSALGQGSKTAYQVGSGLRWDISYSSWDEFPVLQKILAINETAAHLRYLERQGKVRKRRLKGHNEYSMF